MAGDGSTCHLPSSLHSMNAYLGYKHTLTPALSATRRVFVIVYWLIWPISCQRSSYSPLPGPWRRHCGDRTLCGQRHCSGAAHALGTSQWTANQGGDHCIPMNSQQFFLICCSSGGIQLSMTCWLLGGTEHTHAIHSFLCILL